MGKWIFLIFLVWAVWQDLRSRTVGQGFLAAAGSLGAAVSLLSGRSVLGLLSSAAVGIFLLILGQITDGGIGEGDGWFFIVTGFFWSQQKILCFFYRGSFFAVCTALHIWPHPSSEVSASGRKGFRSSPFCFQWDSGWCFPEKRTAACGQLYGGGGAGPCSGLYGYGNDHKRGLYDP